MPGVSRRTYEISVQDHRLQYLSLCARHGSMRAAADYLGVAASSISRQIKLLERVLSIDLVVKGSYKVQLTEAGQLLVEYYDRRVVEHQELMVRLADLRSTRSSTIRVVVAQGLLAGRFLKAFAAVCGRFPDINIEMRTVDGDEAQNLVLNDSAQFGLLFDTAQDVPLKILATTRQPFSLFVPESHALAREKAILPAQISGQRNSGCSTTARPPTGPSASMRCARPARTSRARCSTSRSTRRPRTACTTVPCSRCR
ncbi:LysR family transcriptional regulator [Sphingomonas flavalba]|uniref:LysR family transcriptional regulator n=1 Tax=Sphingomonas flavalba TaxID=2559804 RepID=UPI001EEFAA1A|nr:LysR family transcriptional regulator [Sphingomonas flavalba]